MLLASAAIALLLVAAAAASCCFQFLRTEPERLRTQRHVVESVRTLIANQFGWLRPTPAGQVWDDEPGLRMAASFWTFSLYITTAGMVFEDEHSTSPEGKLLLVFAVAEFLAWVMMLHTRSSKRTLIAMARVNLLRQALNVVLLDFSLVCEVALRRLVLSRSIATAIFIESMEEGLLHSLGHSVLLYWRLSSSSVCALAGMELLPLSLYLCAVLPMQLLGVNDWVLYTARNDKFDASLRTARRLLRGSGLAASIVPVLILANAYLPVSSPPIASLVLAFAFVGVGSMLRVEPWRGAANRWISPNTVAFHKARRRTTTTTAPAAAATTTTTLGGIKPQYVQAEEEDGWEAWWGAAMFGVMCVLRALQWRTLFIALGSGVAMLILLRDRLCSEVESALLVWVGAVLFLCFDDAWLSPVLGFLALALSCQCVILTAARETMFTHIARENDVEAFLSHAIKQKFASVGAALDSLSSSSFAGPTVNGGGTQHLFVLMQSECHIGHAMCFAANIYRKLDQGEERPKAKRSFERLRTALESTPLAALLLGVSATRAATAAQDAIDWKAEASAWAVEMDWDIFNLILTEMARKQRRVVGVTCEIVAQASPTTAGRVAVHHGRVSIVLDLPVRRLNGITLRLLAELRARVVDNVLEIDCRVQTPQDYVPPPAASWAASSSSSRSPSPMLPVVLLAPAAGHFAASSSSPISSSSSSSASQNRSFSANSSSINTSPRQSKLRELLGEADFANLATLRYALLDDNVLIRKNFARLLKQTLMVPDDQIWCRGTSMDECLAFPQLVCDERVDVAIFDQNLDFDEAGDGGRVSSWVRGSDLATRAKLLNFQGCLVLHSSGDDNITGGSGSSSTPFHAVVEKSANPTNFMVAIATAIAQHRGSTTS